MVRSVLHVGVGVQVVVGGWDGAPSDGRAPVRRPTARVAWPGPAVPATRGSDVRGAQQAGEHAADERTGDRDPGVGPVARALALDGQEGVGDTGGEVTSRVDGVP